MTHRTTDAAADVRPPIASFHAKAVPVLIGPKNCEAATGFPWRWVRDTSARLGVPFVGAGQKRAVRADLFVAALERSEPLPANDEQSDLPALAHAADPAAAVRALLKKKRVGAL